MATTRPPFVSISFPLVQWRSEVANVMLVTHIEQEFLGGLCRTTWSGSLIVVYIERLGEGISGWSIMNSLLRESPVGPY